MIRYVLGMYCGLLACCLFGIIVYGIYTSVRVIYKAFRRMLRPEKYRNFF